MVNKQETSNAELGKMSELEAQALIVRRSNQMHDELKKLYAWEKDIKEKDAKRNPMADEEAYDYSYPIRGQIKTLVSDAAVPSTSVQSVGSVKPSTSAQLTEKPKKTPLIPTNSEKANEYKIRGNDRVKIGEYQKAIHYYTEAIRLNSVEPVFYTNRALCYLKQNKFMECIQDCTKAIELDDKSVKAYYRRAQAYEQMKGDLEVALDDCKTVLRIEPKNADAQRTLSRLESVLNGPATKRNLEVNSVAKQIAWPSQFAGKEGYESIDFVEKAPHLRSKQPLKRITIVDSNDTSTSVPATLDSNRVVESTSESSIDQTSQKNSEQIVNTKRLNKSNKMPIIEKIPQTIPVDLAIPRNSAQFYKIWTSIKDDGHKFTVLKGIYGADVNKMLGAQFSLDILREIVTVFKSHFVQQNLPIANILSGIVKNEQMTIISAMMNKEDVLAFTKLMEYARILGEDARKIDAIQKRFDYLISM